MTGLQETYAELQCDDFDETCLDPKLTIGSRRGDKPEFRVVSIVALMEGGRIMSCCETSVSW